MVTNLMDQQDPIADSPSMQPRCTANSVGRSAWAESRSQQHLESPSSLLMRLREIEPSQEGIQRRRSRSRILIKEDKWKALKDVRYQHHLENVNQNRETQYYVPTHRSRGQLRNPAPLPKLRIPLPNRQRDNVPVFLVSKKWYQK
jgi:hypothetical protein